MDLSSILKTQDPVFALKAEARQLQNEARSQGHTLRHAEALEKVAGKYGLMDWNAAVAAARAAGHRARSVQFPWENIEGELPRLPMRPVLAKSGFASKQEVMRWAQQLEAIAEKVPENARCEMLSLVGGHVPYVFFQEHKRWPDGLYHLCNGHYVPFPGIALTREQLTELGVIAWSEQYGVHGGDDMVSVISYDIRSTGETQTLKRAARLLASIVLLVDSIMPGPQSRLQTAEGHS